MKHLLIAAFTSLMLLCQPGFAYNLLTDEQFQELNTLEKTFTEDTEEFISKSIGAAQPGPKIELVQPKIGDTPVPVPLDIELVFSGSDGVEINPDSMRIYYRKFRKYFNVTDTVLENATFDKNRLVSKNVKIRKKGKHRIKVVIKDTQGRTSEKVFKFRL